MSYQWFESQEKVLYNLEKQVEVEEDAFVKLGVLAVILDNVPTIWHTNPVVAPEPNRSRSTRYCSNICVPNQAILCPTREALTMNNVRRKLNGAAVVCYIWMKQTISSYWMQTADMIL